MAKILIVDDDPAIVELVAETLAGHEILTANNGSDGLALAREKLPNLIILDVSMPKLSGTVVCGRLKSDPATAHIPVIMQTAWGTVADVEEAFANKADDYIVKPFSPRELVARIRAVLRRVRGGVQPPDILRVDDLEIDLNAHRVTRSGEPISLTPIEFRLLAALAQNPGATFTRDQLVERLHGVAYEGFDRSVDSHVKNLRRKLEPDPAEPRYVLTVYGVGYRLNDEMAS